MDETISLSKTMLVRLLDAFRPRDDDPTPWGPYGPVVRWDVRHLSWFLLNPQPLPPVSDPQTEPWRTGPQPDPWRAALVARQAIDRLVMEGQFGEVAGSSESAEVVRRHLSELVDDFCGTRPPRWPRPLPWPSPGPGEFRGLDLLMAGAQFQKAADAMTDNPLQADFSAAADQFFAIGLERMQSELQ